MQTWLEYILRRYFTGTSNLETCVGSNIVVLDVCYSQKCCKPHRPECKLHSNCCNPHTGGRCNVHAWPGGPQQDMH